MTLSQKIIALAIRLLSAVWVVYSGYTLLWFWFSRSYSPLTLPVMQAYFPLVINIVIGVLIFRRAIPLARFITQGIDL